MPHDDAIRLPERAQRRAGADPRGAGNQPATGALNADRRNPMPRPEWGVCLVASPESRVESNHRPASFSRNFWKSPFIANAVILAAIYAIYCLLQANAGKKPPVPDEVSICRSAGQGSFACRTAIVATVDPAAYLGERIYARD